MRRHLDSIHAPRHITKLILHGTCIAVGLLSLLLAIYCAAKPVLWMSYCLPIIASCAVYLATAQYLLYRAKFTVVNWMIIIFFLVVAFVTLLIWGINAPVGILTVCFALTLPGILMNSRTIPPVTIAVIVLLCLVQHLHQVGVLTPNVAALATQSTILDVATYITIFSIFSLIGWVAGTQREKNLRRALHAEKAIKAQKSALANELAKESAALRQAQLTQIRQLHRFAFIGQSAVATLHELSNQLSIVNLDIEDIGQLHSNSQAISNAKEGIEHINQIIRQARQQLNSHDHTEQFNAITTIRQSIKDSLPKFEHRRVVLTKVPLVGSKTFNITGSQLALVHCLTILFNNAIDACYEAQNPEVIITLQNRTTSLRITITDNGSGIAPEQLSSLFEPITSTKPSGLGVGLYITHHIIVNQFGGSIRHKAMLVGTQFIITLRK